jgi:hypothetical protein
MIDAKAISKIGSNATAKGQWPLAAAAAALLADPDRIDHRINVAGAMHEVGLLKNSLAPLWTAWRDNDADWHPRCVERLLNGDHDYWALAGFLGTPAGLVRDAICAAGPPLLGVRLSPQLGAQPLHVGLFGIRKSETIIAPMFEIGVDAASGEVVDAMRWRAITLSDQAQGLGGEHSGAYYMRARLPHGGWRVMHAPCAIAPDLLIDPGNSLFAPG